MQDQMLRMDNSCYHDAKAAIIRDDPSAVPPGLPQNLPTQSFRQAGPYGKELVCSRTECWDTWMGADRWKGGPALCCGDFWCHPPPFLCCLPLVRFPAGVFEYEADEGDQSLVELAAGSAHPGIAGHNTLFCLVHRWVLQGTWDVRFERALHRCD